MPDPFGRIESGLTDRVPSADPCQDLGQALEKNRGWTVCQGSSADQSVRAEAIGL